MIRDVSDGTWSWSVPALNLTTCVSHSLWLIGPRDASVVWTPSEGWISWAHLHCEDRAQVTLGGVAWPTGAGMFPVSVVAAAKIPAFTVCVYIISTDSNC